MPVLAPYEDRLVKPILPLVEHPRTYVETSIPSFYFETRTEPEMVARRTWTRAWWLRSLQHTCSTISCREIQSEMRCILLLRLITSASSS